MIACAEEAAEGVGAVAEDITGPVPALILVGHIAALAAVAVVAVALRVEAGAVLAEMTRRVQAIVLRGGGAEADTYIVFSART